MKDKLKWYVVEKEYVSYLKKFDNIEKFQLL